MFGCVAQRSRTTKLLESHEIGKLPLQIEKQLRAGFKSVIRTVVNNRRQPFGCLQNARKMMSLRGRRCASRQYSRNHHQSGGSHIAGVSRMSRCNPRILSTGPHDHWDSCFRQSSHTFLPLLISQ